MVPVFSPYMNMLRVPETILEVPQKNADEQPGELKHVQSQFLILNIFSVSNEV